MFKTATPLLAVLILALVGCQGGLDETQVERLVDDRVDEVESRIREELLAELAESRTATIETGPDSETIIQGNLIIENGGLQLRNTNGDTVAFLISYVGGAWLGLGGPNGERAVSLRSLFRDGQLYMGGGGNEWVVSLESRGGAAELVFRSEGGTEIVELDSIFDEGGLTLGNANLERVVVLDNWGGTGRLLINDKDGDIAVDLGSYDGAGSLWLWNGDHKIFETP